MAFMTKKEVTQIFEEGIKYGILTLVSPYQSASEMAQAQFEEELAIGIDALQKLIEEKRIEYGKEHKGIYALKDGNEVSVMKVDQFRDGIWVCLEKKDNGGYKGFKYDGNEERFQKMLSEGYEKTDVYKEVGKITLSDLDGFSHEEAVDIVMDAIAAGVMQVRHGQIYPYTYGFEIRYGGNTLKPDGNPFTMPENLVSQMEIGKYPSISLKALEQETAEKIRDGLLSSYTPYETTMEYKRTQKNSWERGLIANDQHIDNGYGLDGIIAGRCGGDYSSMTTGSQNDWMRAAVALRGYCLDYVVKNQHFPYREQVLDYHASRGFDLRKPDVLKQWCVEHKGLCFDKAIVQEYQKEVEAEAKRKEMAEKKEVFEKALEDIQVVKKGFDSFLKDQENSKTFLFDAVDDFISHHLGVHAVSEKLSSDEFWFDFNYGALGATIFQNPGKEVALSDGYEVYDTNGEYFGNYTGTEIQEFLDECRISTLEEEQAVGVEKNVIIEDIVEIYTEDQTFSKESVEKFISNAESITNYNWDEIARYICRDEEGNHYLVEMQVPTKAAIDEGYEGCTDIHIVCYGFEGDLEDYSADYECGNSSRFDGNWETALEQMIKATGCEKKERASLEQQIAGAEKKMTTGEEKGLEKENGPVR